MSKNDVVMVRERRPTVSDVREVLNYDPETGIFRWKGKHRKSGHKSDRAGSIDSELGYRAITIHGVKVREHILAWMFVYGCRPASQPARP